MSNYSLFFELFRKARAAGLPHSDHHELVAEFSEDRTKSVRGLSGKEYDLLCQQLRAFGAKDAESMDRMRKKLIGLLKGCGFVLENGKADMPRIYAWVKARGYLKKSLMTYTRKELPQLVFQAEQMHLSAVKKFTKNG